MLKNSITLGLGIIAAATSMVASAIHYSDDLPVKLGEWNSNFEEAMQIADEQHIPVVLFWGGASCTICKNVEAAMDDQEVLDWQARRKIVMVFQDGKEGPMKEFVRNPSSQLPYLCVYWNRGNGVATTNRFSGVVSGASRWPATGTTTAERFINSVELYIHEYQPDERHSGHFACGDTAGNQLEVILNKTKTLYVPLSREMSSAPFVATNYVVSSYSEQTGLPTATNLVAWAAGEAEKLVGVEIPDGGDVRAGDLVTLELLDSEKASVEQCHAKFVKETANSPSNPDWIGEPFEFGRWTFDYVAATNAVAANIAEGQSAYTLVLYTGALWCPYCKGIEGSLLAPGSAFYAWAAANNVALVEFDQGRASSPATAAGTRAPRLLTYDVGQDNNKQDASGAGYLSRHGVLREPAEAKLAETTFYTQKWLAPESTSARLSQPTLLLVKDDEVVARFSAYRNNDKVYDVSENIGRLNDLLKLWNGEGEARGYRTTTDRVCKVGEAREDEVQISAKTVCYRIANPAAGRFAVTRTDNGVEPIQFTLLQGAKSLASSENGLTFEITREIALAGDLVLKATAYSASRMFFNPPEGEPVETTAFDFAFSTAIVLLPDEALVEYTPISDEVQVAVEKGEIYKFGGITGASLEAFFDPGENGTWVAKESGDVTLKAVAAGGTVQYQKWHPGEFAFVDASDLSLDEKTGVVEIAVQRINGVSGESSVAVTVDDSAVTPGRYQIGLLDESGDFVECDPVLTWVDGELGAKSFALKVFDDFAHDGDQTLWLELAVAAGAAKIAEAGAKLKVTLLDDDHDGPGRLAITSIEPGAARGTTVYAFAGTNVLFDVSRYEAADGEVSATLAAKLDGETVPGLLSMTNLVWEDKCRGEAAVKRVKLALPEDKVGSTVTVTLTATGAAPVDFARKTFTVKIVSPAVAKFESDGASWTALTRTYLEQSVAITGAGEGGKLSIRKLSGSLPGGVTAAYDAETGALTFSGTPNRAGAFTASYQVFEELDGVSTAGGTFIASFDVQDIGTVFPSLSPASGSTSRTFRDIYFIEEESKRMAGVLTLTLASNGKLSAKYRCSAGSLALSTTGWGEWDPAAGTVKALLTNRKPDYSGYWAFVTQHANGAVEVELHDNRFPAVYFVRTLTDGDIFGAGRTADAWRGQYTLAMPVIEYRPASDYDIAYTAAAAGDPVFKLRMATKSAIRAGRFTWSGFLPNGKGVSGSAVVNADGTAALVPIFHRDSANLFSALVSVAGGMADDYAESKGGEFGFGLRAITAAKSALNWWEYTDSRTPTLSFAWTYDAYGSYLPDGLDLRDLLLKSGVTDEIVFTADMTKFPDSPTYGKSLGAVEVPVQVGAAEFLCASDEVKLRLDRKTGLVSGSVMLPFEDKTVRANFRGIVLPGWTGCGCHDEDKDLPLILGSTWFNDKVLYVDSATKAKRMLSVRRGCAVSGETQITE